MFFSLDVNIKQLLDLQNESESVSLPQLTWKTPDKKREECSFKGKDLQASDSLTS